MADSRTSQQGGGGEQRDSSTRRVPTVRNVPSTQTSRLAADADADALDVPVEPSDETPTTISRNPPRPAPTADRAGADQSTTDIRGHRLAHFELIGQIGVGGMAAVLKARDTQLDRAVALKILPPDMAADPENIRRFQKEAQAAAKLDHENIARVFFCGEDQGLHFIAFEFVEGENLRQVMERKGGRLPVAEALAYLIQVATGLAHAAERGVVHRDIKPSNIIITPAGRAKLVDLGLARNLERRDEKSLTHSGVTLGTFDYISPEQALEPRDADERSDIYSLGCTFYHMLTGRPPVPEGTPARKLHHHQNVKPVDPRELVAGLPDDVVFILNRMLAKRPEDRYQRAVYLVRDLVAAARKIGVQADMPEGTLPALLPATGPSRAPMLVLAGLAVAAVVVIILSLETPSPRETRPSVSNPVKDNIKDKGPGTTVLPDPPVKDGKDKGPGTPVPPDPPTPSDTAVYTNEAEGSPKLADWLASETARDKAKLDITLARDEDFPTQYDALATGFRIQASQRIEIKAAKGCRPTLRLHYTGSEIQAVPQTWAALTLEAPNTSVTGLRIIVDRTLAPLTTEKEDRPAEMIGLLLKGGGDHTVKNCDFFQSQPSYEKRRQASVLFEAGTSSSTSPRLVLGDCCFLGYRTQSPQEPKETITLQAMKDDGSKEGNGGIDAVVVRGKATVTATQCFFGPHQADFVFNSPGVSDHLSADHCTFALGGDSTVVQLGDQSVARLLLEHCLASRLGKGGGVDLTAGRSSLIRQIGESDTAGFTGKDNRYFGLDAFWRSGDTTDIEFSEDLALALKEKSRGSDTSRILKKSPWAVEAFSKIDPFTLPINRQNARVQATEENDLFGAFLADKTEPALRTSEAPSRLMGVDARGTTLTVKLPTLVEPAPLTPRDLIVDPKKDDPTNGRYKTLAEAILAARPGDSILLQFSEVMAVKPQILEEAAINLTIKAYTGCTPILTLADNKDPEQVLFQLYDGQLRFEGIEIRLAPRREYKSQAVVGLAGSGRCYFERCIVTLDPTGSEPTHLSLAVIPDPKDAMPRMDSPRPASGPSSLPMPQLALTNSLVRGVGEVLRARVCRPISLEMSGSLAVLLGSVFALDGKDGVGSSSSPPPFALKLIHSTTCASGPLLSLKASRGFKLPLGIQIQAEDCLFLPAGTASTFIRLEGTEMDAEKLKERLTWKAARTNAYGSYSIFLEQPSLTDDTPLNQEGWAEFGAEAGARWRAGLAVSPSTDPGVITKTTPMQYRPMDLPGNFGADVTSLQKMLPLGESPVP
jgi:serine/threonine protein kinase